MKKFLDKYAPILLMAICAIGIGLLFYFKVIDLDTIPQLVKNNLLEALLIILALYILKGFSGVILYNAIVVLVSVMFPLWEAILINCVGTAITLSISYIIGFRTSTDKIDEMLDRNPKIKKYVSKAKEYDFVASFAIHLLGLSMEVLGLIFGFMRITYWKYLLSSWLAIIPGMITLTIVGSTWDFKNPAFWIVLVADIILIVFAIIYTKKHILKEENEEGANE